MKRVPEGEEDRDWAQMALWSEELENSRTEQETGIMPGTSTD